MTVDDPQFKPAQFVEQGMSVFRVSDSEWYCAADFDQAWQQFQRDVGEEVVFYDTYVVSRAPVDLDQMTMTDIDEDERPIGQISFREAIRRRLLEEANPFPGCLCALDW